MDPDATSPSRTPSSKTASSAAPNDAELSRIARDVIHQPADPRLDRELARMGLGADPRAAQDPPVQPTSPSVEFGSGLERLDAKLRRVELTLWAVMVAVGILALTVVLLVLR